MYRGSCFRNRMESIRTHKKINESRKNKRNKRKKMVSNIKELVHLIIHG